MQSAFNMKLIASLLIVLSSAVTAHPPRVKGKSGKASSSRQKDSECLRQGTCLSRIHILFSNRATTSQMFSFSRIRLLRVADFTGGTLVIDTAGLYRLCEDITFNPNPPSDTVSPADAFDPIEYGGLYDENSFGLGFFAAIAITADNVTLYLNGHTLEQSEGHALMQRFYAHIELNNSPFIPGAGPAQFVGQDEEFRAPSNIRILGPGTLGRASHHGIHGNNNKNVEITGITFQDFEVAAVSLNNVDDLVIRNNVILQNRHDVPVSGMFSAARFIRYVRVWQ